MKRAIRSTRKEAVTAPEWLPAPPDTVCIPLDAAINRCEMREVVRAGEEVVRGAPVAAGEHMVAHAPISGRVERADANGIVLRRDEIGGKDAFPACPTPTAAMLPAFAREMGWAGMGGSLFPASIKLRAAKRIHTLVINAVECEPGIQIDEALLLHDRETVRAGCDMIVDTLGIGKTVLAVKRSSAAGVAAFATVGNLEVLRMPHRYPAGAEKLIVARLEGQMPPAGRLPMERGYLVFSVASLWALGRRVRTGEPSIVRPLTVRTPQGARNLFVPVGTAVGHVLKAAGVKVNPEHDVIVAGGLMMGKRVDETSPVLKGTNAIFAFPAGARLSHPEQPCILCGSCFDVCPLKLHPIGMANRIRQERRSGALTAQLEECFLCGACSAVCPSDIPLVQVFHRGKAWLRKTI